MSTEADNQPKQKIDIAHEDLSNNALRAHVHGPEVAERHNTVVWTKRRKFLAGGLALGLIGGGVVVESIISNNLTPNHQTDGTDVQPTTDPSAIAQEGFPPTAQPSPSSTEVINTLPVTPNPEVSNSTLKSLEIKAGQSPEELAKNYTRIGNEWINAGCDEATLQESSKQTSITLEEYSTKKATELATPYIIALFGPDYKTNPRAMNYLENGIKLNAGVIESYIRSDPTYNKDVKAHYKQTENFDSMVSSTQNGDVTTLVFNGHLENNSKDAPGVLTEMPSGKKVRYTVQFKAVDGVERLVQSDSIDL